MSGNNRVRKEVGYRIYVLAGGLRPRRRGIEVVALTAFARRHHQYA
jgi:hypothetical protein